MEVQAMDDIERGQGEDLVVVYHAPDQLSAEVVKSYLDDEGIPAVIESKMVAWMDGLMKMGEGYWGNVVAPAEHAERAKLVVQAFLDGASQSTNEQ
jgi:hypothetical protein